MPYEDGTNVAKGTDYAVQFSRTTDWYRPADSKAVRNWKAQIKRLQDRFEELSRTYRPVKCVMVQSRIPAFEKRASAISSVVREKKMIQAGSGLAREFSFLIDSKYNALFGDFPVLDASGKPICNTAHDPFAVRFGLSRMHFLCPAANYVSVSRDLPAPQQDEVFRDGTSLLYGAPPSVALAL